MLEFRGVHLDILNDATEEQDVEGSLSCGKTTVCLWRELEAYKYNPGIWGLLGRWSGDAVKTLLRPAFEQLARIHGTVWEWDRDENCYNFPNGSRAFAFGLATQSTDPVQRYGKIRGLPVSRIYIDQAEQLPADIASELRARLRPDIEARLRGVRYPRMLTFSPNPVNTGHWLARQFPTNNSVKGRRYRCLSLFDNRHNLPEEMIESMLREFPPEHPKHTTVILGQRGMNVIGDAVYDQIFNRALHVKAVPAYQARLIEAFEIGRHNPTWIIGARTYHGALVCLGGIQGKGMIVDDFLPLVKRYRDEWFSGLPIQTAAGAKLARLLRDAGFDPISRPNSDAHDVQLETIEQIAGMLRRRVSGTEESFSISNDLDRWIVVEEDGAEKRTPFLAFAFEGGYVWSPHTVSVANKELKQPHADDEYANAMRCVEHLVLNFCAGQSTDADRERRDQQPRGDQLFASVAHLPHGWLGQ